MLYTGITLIYYLLLFDSKFHEPEVGLLFFSFNGEE